MEHKKRELIEEKFHDKLVRRIDDELGITDYFQNATQTANRNILKFLGDLKGRKLLDIGCGTGQTSCFFAKRGAVVTAIDISGEMIKRTKALAKKQGLNITAIKMSGNKLAFKDNSFDIVYGCGILHHLSLHTAAAEISRVLKKGGKGGFMEPLNHNPLLKLYRRSLVHQGVNTPTEMPLTYKQIKSLKKHFTKVTHRDFHFFTMITFLILPFSKRARKSNEPAWRKFIIYGDDVRAIFNFLYQIDKIFLFFFPFFRRFCWHTSIKMIN